MLAVAATAAVPAAADAAYKPFRSPSGAIHCAYLSGSGVKPMIRCDPKFLNDRAAVVAVRGKAKFVDVTDTVADPESPVLAYGKTRRFGKLRCTSRRSGMTCKSTASGHGFFLSREKRRTF